MMERHTADRRAQRHWPRNRPRWLPDRAFGFSAFVIDNGTIYQAYSTTGRGVEFLMSYYPIFDRAPRGRDEGEDWQLWIRRHDEY